MGDTNSAGGLIGGIAVVLHQFQPILLKDVKREGGRDFVSFLQIAIGSATEVVYLILLCKDIKLLLPQIYEDLQIETTQIKKM